MRPLRRADVVIHTGAIATLVMCCGAVCVLLVLGRWGDVLYAAAIFGLMSLVRALPERTRILRAVEENVTPPAGAAAEDPSITRRRELRKWALGVPLLVLLAVAVQARALPLDDPLSTLAFATGFVAGLAVDNLKLVRWLEKWQRDEGRIVLFTRRPQSRRQTYIALPELTPTPPRGPGS